MELAFKLRDQLTYALKSAGFSYVTQDLEGYRSGSFDEGQVNADPSDGELA
jgi:PP-loop superfamily ATP-utilizing enzyme